MNARPPLAPPCPAHRQPCATEHGDSVSSPTQVSTSREDAGPPGPAQPRSTQAPGRPTSFGQPALRKDRYFIAGALSPEMLIEIMQLLHRVQRTGELVLELSSATARIYFVDGEVIHVSVGLHGMSGHDAFQIVLRSCEGFYYFIDHAVVTVDRSILSKCEHLILDALKQLDEEKNLS